MYPVLDFELVWGALKQSATHFFKAQALQRAARILRHLQLSFLAASPRSRETQCGPNCLIQHLRLSVDEEDVDYRDISLAIGLLGCIK